MSPSAEAHCRSCGSCGFPMRQLADFAGHNPDAAYCSTCGDETGTLRPYEQVVEANAAYFVREQAIDGTAAESMARALLSTMPAWQQRR